MSQCRENKSDRGPGDLPKSHTLPIPEGRRESWASRQSTDLMYLKGSTPTRQCRNVWKRTALCILHRCVASMAGLPGDFPPQSILRRADIACLGPWSHPFQEFGHDHGLLICNNCHCSVVMQKSPSTDGTISLR